MSAVPQRLSVMALVAEAVNGGARLAPACAVLGFSERTFQRWQLGAEVGADARSLRHEPPSHKLSIRERATVLAVANSAEFGAWLHSSCGRARARAKMRRLSRRTSPNGC